MELVQTLVRGIWTELIGYFGSRELQHFILSRRTPGVVLCPCDWLFLWGDVFMVLSVTRAKFRGSQGQSGALDPAQVFALWLPFC